MTQTETRNIFYLTGSPWWMRMLAPRSEWRINTNEKKLYLTFDDGPVPNATPFVLDELKRFGAKASFFCIGENVRKHPELYDRILAEGHTVGNHTAHHLNGWKTGTVEYLADISDAASLIRSSLFRPPYGRIKRSQARGLAAAMGNEDARIVMWSVISGDFDTERSGLSCFRVVKKKAREGSIVVFHDSEKAFPNLSYALPRILEHFSKKGYSFEKLPTNRKE